MSKKNSQPGQRGPRRWEIRLSLGIQIVCVTFLLIAVNVLAYRFYERWDFSRSQKFSLAEQTKRVLRDITEPVNILVYFSPSHLSHESALYRDVDNLLREYQFSGKDRITVERIDPARDQARAREVQAKYQFGGEDNVLVLEFGGDTKLVRVGDMAEFDFSGLTSGEPPRLVAFRGEAVLTSAMLELLNPEKQKIYFLRGHGEVAPVEGGPLQTLVAALSRQFVEMATLDLSTLDRVPGDAALVCILAPAFDLPARELDVLERYWKSQGRMIVALDPDAHTPGLHGFLVDKGIIPQENRVLRTAESPVVPGVIGIWRIVVGKILPDSAMTKRFEGVNMLFDGSTQSLLLNQEVAEERGIQLRPLVLAEESFWGETDFDDLTAGVDFDESTDHTQPLFLAASAELGAIEDDRVEVASSALLVVGNSEFIRDQSIAQSPVNADFFISAVNWMLDRTRLTGIAPRAAGSTTLRLTNEQMRNLAFYSIIAMPGVVAILGIFVAVARRR